MARWGRGSAPEDPCIASHRRCCDVNDNHAKLARTFLVADISSLRPTPDLEIGLTKVESDRNMKTLQFDRSPQTHRSIQSAYSGKFRTMKATNNQYPTNLTKQAI